MKILYDHQIFSQQVYGGISRYFFELMRQFSKNPEVSFQLSVKFSNNHYLEHSGFSNHKNFFKNFTLFGIPYFTRRRNEVMHFLNEKQSRRFLAKQDFDIFHPTYFRTYFLDLLGEKPFVLTIYDMIHELIINKFTTKDPTSLNKKILAQKAAKIIAISENTKKDIVKILGIADEKIKVVHLANSVNPNSLCEFNLPSDKYLLFVGDRAGYKNFQLFISAIVPLLNEDKSLNVICVGSRPFSRRELKFLDDLNLKNQLFYFSVTDEQMAFLYKKAIAFVFPSKYEGFGIPVLEAFACSCPAILSRASCLPEVGADAAEYFDPDNEDDIRQTISKVITDKNKQQDLKRKGIIRLQQFSWEKTAKQTLDIYRSIL